MPTGRPTDYNDAIEEEFLMRLVEGESVNSICQDDHMPSVATIYNWLKKHPGFLERYEDARLNQADTAADKIQDIANRTLRGEYDPKAARVALDANKWIAAKLKPVKYADKFAVGGAAEMPPIQTQVTTTLNIEGLSVEQLEALQAALMKTMEGNGT